MCSDRSLKWSDGSSVPFNNADRLRFLVVVHRKPQNDLISVELNRAAPAAAAHQLSALLFPFPLRFSILPFCSSHSFMVPLNSLHTQTHRRTHFSKLPFSLL